MSLWVLAGNMRDTGWWRGWVGGFSVALTIVNALAVFGGVVSAAVGWSDNE